MHVPIHQILQLAVLHVMRNSRVHEESPPPPNSLSHAAGNSKLTVWQQSLLFNGRGYTVYDDSTGGLIFRVDNYASNWRMEMFLMDSTGRVLFTIKRSPRLLRLFFDRWQVFSGEIQTERPPPLIRATKAFDTGGCNVSSAAGDQYQIRWSAQEGWSRIYQVTAATLFLVAEVNRKVGKSGPGSMIGKDVYALTVYPGMDQATAMALLMIIDAMR